MAQHNDIGRWGEDKAAEYLRSIGLYIKHRDWHYGHMDLDLVCIDEEETMLIIVEVKTRSTSLYGEPDEAIDLEKKHNLIAATRAYLKAYRLHYLQVRYDTISIVGTCDEDMQLTHKEKAFDILDEYEFYEEKRHHIWPYKPF